MQIAVLRIDLGKNSCSMVGLEGVPPPAAASCWPRQRLVQQLIPVHVAAWIRVGRHAYCRAYRRAEAIRMDRATMRTVHS